MDTSTTPPTPPIETRGWPHGPTAFEQRHGNAKMRVVSGLIGIPIVLAAVWYGGWLFFLFICAAIVGAMLEFYWLAEAKGARPHKVIGVVFGLIFAMTFFHGLLDRRSIGAFEPVDMFIDGEPYIYLVRFFMLLIAVCGLVVTTLIAEMRRESPAPIVNNATTFSGAIYVGLFLATLIGIRQLFTTDPMMGEYLTSVHQATRYSGVTRPENLGAFMVMAVLASIWICDSGAYYVGRAMGKHKMAPKISPKKTWEGGIGGAVFAVAAMIGFKYWLLPFLTLGDAIVLGLVVGILGQVGDLVESHVKRDAGIKDSSNIIPGHGGVFDRLDSLMFVAPIVYLYLVGIALFR